MAYRGTASAESQLSAARVGGRSSTPAFMIEDADVLTWYLWVEFCSRGVVSEDVEAEH